MKRSSTAKFSLKTLCVFDLCGLSSSWRGRRRLIKKGTTGFTSGEAISENYRSSKGYNRKKKKRMIGKCCNMFFLVLLGGGVVRQRCCDGLVPHCILHLTFVSACQVKPHQDKQPVRTDVGPMVEQACTFRPERKRTPYRLRLMNDVWNQKKNRQWS